MVVSFVNSTHRWGGVKTWTLAVARGLTARGHRVHLCLRRGDPFLDACRDEGLPADGFRFGPDWNPLAVLALTRAFRREGTWVVVTNVSKDNRVGGPAARGLGLPVLQRVGGPGDLRDRFKVRWEQRRYVDRIVVPGAAVKDALARFPWIDAERKIRVVPNGVDLLRFRPGEGAGRLRSELGLQASVPIVVTTGQLTPVKGHRFLLEGMARGAFGEPRPVVVLIGSGPREGPLRELARSLGTADRVCFLGFRRDLPLLLEDADVVVQPSLMEGLPHSVVEFLAKGKAIVATRLPGTGEAIEHGEHGILVPPGDGDALARAVAELLADPARRRRLGQAARKRAETEFALETMVDRMERLLEDLASQGDGANRA